MGPIVDERPLPGLLPPRRKRKRRWVRVLLVFLILLATGATWVFQPSWLNHLDQPIVFWEDEPGYTRYIDHHTDWTLRFPDSWHATHIAEHGPRQGRYRPHHFGVFISNVRVSEEEVWAEGMPANVVAVRVAYDYSGGPLFGEGSCDHDTRLPLLLSNASSSKAAVRDDAGGAVTAFWLPFAFRGDMLQSVRAWFGSRASEEDRGIAERIVGSISYPTDPSRWVTDPSSRPSQGLAAYRCWMENELKRLGGKVS